MQDDDLTTQLDGLFGNSDIEMSANDEKLTVERTIIGLLDTTEQSSNQPSPPTASSPIPDPPLDETSAPATDETEQSTPMEKSSVSLAWETQLREQQTRVLNIMLTSLVGVGTAIIIFLIVNLIQEPARWLIAYIPYFAAYAVLFTLAVGRRIKPKIRASGLIALTYGVGVTVLLTEGPISGAGLYLITGSILSSILIGQRIGIAGAAASILIYAAGLLAEHVGWLQPTAPYDATVLPSVLSMTATFALINAAIIFAQSMSNRALTSALKEAEQEHTTALRSQIMLEERANELGKANALLQKRTLQLQTVAQVSSAATFSVLDPEKLAQHVVDLVHDRFALYHVGFFLTDESGEWANLKADANELGHHVPAERQQIKVDTSSTVGWAIINARTRIAASPDEISLPLPSTRSEVTLPLRSRGRVIGALTLQSTERDAFPDEDIPVLQTMTDQIAVAMDNAQLFAEAQAHLQQVEDIQRQYVRERWTEFITTQASPHYERTRPNVSPLGEIPPPEVEQALLQHQSIVHSDAGNGTGQAALVVPISLREQPLGVLGLQEMANERKWTPDEVALIEAVADQMALAIENARLLEETQRRAEIERRTADIATRIRASTQVDSILRTAIRELGRTLRASEGVIQLNIGTEVGADRNRDPQNTNPESPVVEDTDAND